MLPDRTCRVTYNGPQVTSNVDVAWRGGWRRRRSRRVSGKAWRSGGRAMRCDSSVWHSGVVGGIQALRFGAESFACDNNRKKVNGGLGNVRARWSLVDCGACLRPREMHKRLSFSHPHYPQPLKDSVPHAWSSVTSNTAEVASRTVSFRTPFSQFFLIRPDVNTAPKTTEHNW